jgi:hypothetical protein
MDKDFLTDYAAKQLEEDMKFAQLLLGSKFEAAREFSKARIGKLVEPVGRSAQYFSLWPQVPFFGTITVPLSPFSEPHFKVHHGFGASDIDDLVDFARNTSRIAFVLNDSAEEFAGLDFLDPIFTEMKPTMDITFPPRLLAERQKEYMSYITEFDTLARINFYRYMDKITQLMTQSLGPSADRSINWATNLMHTYAYLGTMGYNDIKEAIADCIVESPYTAHGMLLCIDQLLVSPMTDPYGAIHNITTEQVNRWKSVAGRLGLHHGSKVYESILREGKDMQFPSEIGRFLTRKMHNYPETLDGCRFVCGLYDKYELRRIVVSLQQAISQKDYSSISSNASQLSEALDKVWDDSSQAGRNKKAISAGMTIGLGLVGAVASGPIGPLSGGLLGGLGFQVVEQILDVKTDSISDRLSKWVTPNYLVNIYEFRQDTMKNKASSR